MHVNVIPIEKPILQRDIIGRNKNGVDPEQVRQNLIFSAGMFLSEFWKLAEDYCNRYPITYVKCLIKLLIYTLPNPLVNSLKRKRSIGLPAVTRDWLTRASLMTS